MSRITTDFRGIIMFRRDYRERDLLVKILTDKIGPAMFFVKGAKKRGFRLAADILPFTHGEYIGSLTDNGLSFINTASDTSQYRSIASDTFSAYFSTLSLNLLLTYIEIPDTTNVNANNSHLIKSKEIAPIKSLNPVSI